MIRKLVRQMLTAQIFSALTVSLCLLIDSIMISRFLGEEAIAAYGLANPLLLGIGAMGTLLAAGVQVVCSRALGRGNQEEANAGYSSALAATAFTSLLFMALVIPLRAPFAQLLGAGNGSLLHQKTQDYLAGFSIGAPGSMGALALVPFLQMAGQSNLLILAVLAMTLTDIGLDLLNVFVFHGDMFGMGLASALSYYAAMAVAGIYFLSGKSIFRFSRKAAGRKMIGKLFMNGIPASVNMLASVILVYLMNQMLQQLDGSHAIAAYTVIISIGNAANCITTGIGGVSLTLGGVLYHEEDRSGLRELIRLLCRYSVILGLGVGMILVVFAPAFISAFIPQTGKTQEMAILGLRMFAAGLIPCCVNNTLKNYYQASGRPGLTEIVSLTEGAVFPALAAFVFSRFLGTNGAWLAFAAGELLTLPLIALHIRKISGRSIRKEDAVLLLKQDFGADGDRMLERNITSLEEVAAASEETEQFCMRCGQDPQAGNHIALCVEEVAANVIQHGFSRDGKPHHLSIRILEKQGRWVLRFRDDCTAFDPLHFVPEEGQQALGIRLVMAMAEEAHYTYSMNLNNLVLKLQGKPEPESRTAQDK